MHEDQYNRFVKRVKKVTPKTISEHNQSKQDEIISMAREAGIGALTDYGKEALERFAALAFVAGAAHEREACAKVAERFEPDEKCSYVEYASAAIRARGNNK